MLKALADYAETSFKVTNMAMTTMSPDKGRLYKCAMHIPAFIRSASFIRC